MDERCLDYVVGRLQEILHDADAISFKEFGENPVPAEALKLISTLTALLERANALAQVLNEFFFYLSRNQVHLSDLPYVVQLGCI